ncbi:hypothetical protein PPACK8108_LOCUS19498 [Phakopsora pachyrhizi]|uniref:Sin3 C-terminal domain-containing protein n=1 Tax=Phakopsora pachyrhizi TaxID=170000 RepID=A0AAV0BCX2_PHAPC|nr:hypothetical protein PPACK8108_LOCUS19498 [Phakopsora pachyrhizi]
MKNASNGGLMTSKRASARQSKANKAQANNVCRPYQGAEETGEAGDGVTTQMVSSHLRQSLADSKTKAQSSAYKISGKIKLAILSNDEASKQIFNLFQENKNLEDKIEGGLNQTQRLLYRKSVETLTGGMNTKLYHIEGVPIIQAIRVQLIGGDNINPEDYDSVERAWSRNLKLVKGKEEERVGDGEQFISQSRLRIRVCMRSYQLFFSTNMFKYLIRIKKETNKLLIEGINNVMDCQYNTIRSQANSPLNVPSFPPIRTDVVAVWNTVYEMAQGKPFLNWSSHLPPPETPHKVPLVPYSQKLLTKEDRCNYSASGYNSLDGQSSSSHLSHTTRKSLGIKFNSINPGDEIDKLKS